jgi:hypothetical protein
MIFLLHEVKTGSGANPISSSMDTEKNMPGLQ